MFIAAPSSPAAAVSSATRCTIAKAPSPAARVTVSVHPTRPILLAQTSGPVPASATMSSIPAAQCSIPAAAISEWFSPIMATSLSASCPFRSSVSAAATAIHAPLSPTAANPLAGKPGFRSTAADFLSLFIVVSPHLVFSILFGKATTTVRGAASAAWCACLIPLACDSSTCERPGNARHGAIVDGMMSLTRGQWCFDAAVAAGFIAIGQYELRFLPDSGYQEGPLALNTALSFLCAAPLIVRRRLPFPALAMSAAPW